MMIVRKKQEPQLIPPRLRAIQIVRGGKPMLIRGLGPHGERASTLQQLKLSEQDAEDLRKTQRTVAIVLHTTTSDWAKQQLAGIVGTFGLYSTAVIEVVDCAFSFEAQIRALLRLSKNPPSAVISIPIGNTAVVDAHRSISHSGAKLTLLDNAPTGLLPGKDYVGVVSADNFGLGEIAAELLSPHIPAGGSIGIVSYGIDFFVTHQREIAFRKWMAHARPDVTLQTARFADVNLVAPTVDSFLTAVPDLAGLFAVWDDPAMQAVAAVRARERDLPMTTVDLGNEAAIEMAGGGLIKGIGAQRPYDQGIAAATVTLQALLGHDPPRWVALPGVSVTAVNLLGAYQTVWHVPAPSALVATLQTRQAGTATSGTAPAQWHRSAI
jgi:ribose transport system substrate-binding protein